MEVSNDCVPTDSSIVFDFKVSGQNVIKAANEDDFTKCNFTTSDIKIQIQMASGCHRGQVLFCFELVDQAMVVPFIAPTTSNC